MLIAIKNNYLLRMKSYCYDIGFILKSEAFHVKRFNHRRNIN